MADDGCGALETDRGGRGVRLMGKEGVACSLAFMSCKHSFIHSLAHSYADKWMICAAYQFRILYICSSTYNRMVALTV